MADGPVELKLDDAGASRLERHLGRAMLAARWLIAPIYVGLLAALLLVAVKFIQKLATTVPLILGMDGNETVLAVLALIDLSLVGNLVVIVVFAGWGNFVGPLTAARKTGTLSTLGFSAVKQKLIGSIAAIAAIELLETFEHIDSVSKTDAMWQLAILLGIGVTGVLLAVMDRLSSDKH